MNTKSNFHIRLFTLFLTVLCFTITKAQETSNFTNPESDFQKGVTAFQLEKYGTAESYFTSYIQSNLNHVFSEECQSDLLNAYFYQAVCAEKLLQPVAETYFLNLCQSYEENPVTRIAYFHLGNIYFNQKKIDKAIIWYSKVDLFDLDENEKSDFKFRFGYCYFTKQDFLKALPYFEQTKDQQTEYYYPANYYYAYICYTRKNYDDALRSFKILESTKLYTAVIPYYITNIYYLQKKFQQLIDYAEPKLNDKTLTYREDLSQLVGKAYFGLGNYSAALPLLSTWFNNSTSNTKNDIYEIAYCQYMTGKYDDAAYYFLQLNSLKDSVGQNAVYMLGNCYLKTNQKEKARTAFLNAGKFSFDKFIQENALFNYAKLNVELSYNDVAVSSLQNFISEFPTSNYSNDAKELLTQVFLKTKNYKEALTIIQSINPKSAEIKKAYQKVAFYRGVQIYQEGDLAGANKLFDESLLNTADPDITAQCYFWKAEYYFEKKFYNESIKNHLRFLDMLDLKLNLPPTINKACSNYTLGYCYLKLSNYSLAQTYFDNARLMLSSPSSYLEVQNQNTSLYPDALLRLADCEFKLKQYSKAADNYQTVISNQFTGTDYALYQSAIIKGLQSDASAKISALLSIDKNYPQSIYLDDALFELGNTYLNEAKYTEAIPVFQRITKEFTQSLFAPKAYNKLGLIYFNQGDNDQAQSNYQIVLTNFNKSSDLGDAIKGLKEIYIDKGDPQGFLNLINGLPNINISSQETDSLLYRSGENKFVKGECEAAQSDFTNYLNQFPKGAFSLEAHFYRAECSFKNENYPAALEDYEFVNKESNNRFSEKSLLQSARIYYTHLKDFQKAYEAYSNLLTIASFKSNAFEATQGMMYCAWNLKMFNEVISASKAVLKNELASSDDLVQAHYYLAKVYLIQNKTADAGTEFEMVAQANQGDLSSESLYELAHIAYLKNDTATALKKCDAIFSSPPSNNYWLAKTYLLIAHIQFDASDYFQSKSTLQSIIDNYKMQDDILPEANQLLGEVLSKEAEQIRITDENLNAPLKIDSIQQQENINPQDH